MNRRSSSRPVRTGLIVPAPRSPRPLPAPVPYGLRLAARRGLRFPGFSRLPGRGGPRLSGFSRLPGRGGLRLAAPTIR
nr:hypothetical protein GCM10020093_095100 [Planobispora longispora]